MISVSVEVDGKVESAQISEDTHEILRDGSFLRGRPMQFYLFCTVKKYGTLTEENILKYIDEYWVL